MHSPTMTMKCTAAVMLQMHERGEGLALMESADEDSKEFPGQHLLEQLLVVR